MQSGQCAAGRAGQVLADFKSPDVGGLEAKMAFDAGADMMTVIGETALATVESALEAAKAARKEMLMELTGVRDILLARQGWRQIGVERMVYHRGWDEQTFARQWVEEDRTVIRRSSTWASRSPSRAA